MTAAINEFRLRFFIKFLLIFNIHLLLHIFKIHLVSNIENYIFYDLGYIIILYKIHVNSS